MAASSFTTSTLSTTDLPSQSTPRVTSDNDDDNDHIVWDVSEGSDSALFITSDDDFVILAKSRSEDDPLEQQTPVSVAKSQMSISSCPKPAVKKRKKSKRSKKATPSSAPDTTTTSTTSRQHRHKKSSAESPKQADILQVVSAFERLSLGQQPIVSEQRSVVGDKTPTVYEEASTFISRFLSDPHAKTDKICRLTLLQSLIIELGLGTSSSLPPSLRAAKAFLKAHAFLNIREYMAVRGQGSEAVQRVMYPSKSALIKSIKRNPTPIKWVKELGLQVLLVGFMH